MHLVPDERHGERQGDAECQCQFALVTPTRTLLLRAASHAEALLWVEALRQRLGEGRAASGGEAQPPAAYGARAYGAAAYGAGVPSLLCVSLLDEHDSPHRAKPVLARPHHRPNHRTPLHTPAYPCPHPKEPCEALGAIASSP